VNRELNTCAGCLWEEECRRMTNFDAVGCDDYCAADDDYRNDELAYEDDLAMRAKTYYSIMEDYI